MKPDYVYVYSTCVCMQVREDKPFRFAVGSFIQNSDNYVDIIHCARSSLAHMLEHYVVDQTFLCCKCELGYTTSSAFCKSVVSRADHLSGSERRCVQMMTAAIPWCPFLRFVYPNLFLPRRLSSCPASKHQIAICSLRHPKTSLCGMSDKKKAKLKEFWTCVPQVAALCCHQ